MNTARVRSRGRSDDESAKVPASASTLPKGGRGRSEGVQHSRDPSSGLHPLRTSLRRKEPLGSRAYRELHHRLITLALRPGDRFTEQQLVQQLGIGHTPVREALALLVRDGLVTSRPRVGYVVTPITVQGVADLFELRLIVEPAAVRLAASRVDARQLERLEALGRGAYRHDDPESIEAFLDSNHEFHVGIAEASGNRRLASVVAAVLEESRRVTHLRLRLEPKGERFVHEHEDLLRALRDRNAEEAHRLAFEQTSAARDELIAALISSSRLMELPITLEP